MKVDVEEEITDNSSDEALKPTEGFSKPSEVEEEISSKQNDDSVKEDDSQKNSAIIKKYSQLCVDNCLYTFSKVVKEVDSSQLDYKGKVTGCVDYLITPIINETANTFIKGASIYKWNESLYIWLDRDYGALYRAYYMKYGNGASNGISEENVMVFEANLIFNSDDNEYGERANTKIILIKDAVSSIWQVDGLYW